MALTVVLVRKGRDEISKPRISSEILEILRKISTSQAIKRLFASFSRKRSARRVGDQTKLTTTTEAQ
jgi:hypothetical protein